MNSLSFELVSEWIEDLPSVRLFENEVRQVATILLSSNDTQQAVVVVEVVLCVFLMNALTRRIGVYSFTFLFFM